ncbi:MAG: hypothetical protein J6S31_08380 [Lachnospiraceae bacterium]|nr:hypothetical protein [Lachnospiraceae bacterium]
MTGKEKCKILKEIRREIAQQNDIEWIVNECRHKGECKGTCPRCESEVKKLEQELEKRKKVGKTIALVGISAACLAGLIACRPDYYSHSNPGAIEIPGGGGEICGGIEVLDGDIAEPVPDDDLSGYVGG